VTVPAEALRRAEPYAIDWLYREFGRTVLNWVIRLGGPGLDAPDVAHDVFAMAIRRVDSWQPDAPIAPWLFGVTRRVVANARRRAKFRRFFGLESAPVATEPGPGPDEEAWRSWRRLRVQIALDRLSDAHREAIVLTDLDERPAAEVAAILGIPVGTVYSRVHAARKALAADLEEDLGPMSIAVRP
jgi:RNA polymerase sigma-70 factor (ECF subfamily)